MKFTSAIVALCAVISDISPVMGAMLIGQNILWFPHNRGWGQEFDLYQPTVNFAATDNPWKPAVITELTPFAMIRFMDGSMININYDTEWMDRVQKTDAEQDCDWADNEGRKDNGMAYEWQIDLCNRLGRDYWVNIPTRSITALNVKGGGIPDYPLRLAIMIRHGIDMKTVDLTPMMDNLSTMSADDFIAAGGVRTSAGLNPTLHVYVEYSNETWLFCWDYVSAQASALGSGLAGFDFHAIAALRSAAAFFKVFGAGSPRVRPVFAGQYGNPWHCQQQVKMIPNTAYNPEKIKIYGIAMAPYYDGSNLGPISAGTDGPSLAHRKIATDAGIKLLCYEGGVQGNGTAGTPNTGRPNLYQEYLAYLAGLEKCGVDEFCQYGYAGANGWGSKESIGQPLETAYKYKALLEVAQKNNPPEVTSPVLQPAHRAAAAASRAPEKGRLMVDMRGRAITRQDTRQTPQLLFATGAAGKHTVVVR